MNLFVSHRQIAVFQANMENPFNNWEKEHTAQGFSWRKSSVSFGTLLDGGDASITIQVSETFDPKVDAARIIKVPFSVECEPKIEIATISQSIFFDIDISNYSLYFQSGFSREEKMWCDFTFCEQEKSMPEIIRADENIIVPQDYLMEAQSA